jgi:hypothetical protein
VHKWHLIFPRWAQPILAILRPGVYFTHKMAVDPKWQFVFNALFTTFWLIAMIFVLFLPTFHGSANTPALLIMEVSLWANFISHYGALGGNVAAIIASNIGIVVPPTSTSHNKTDLPRVG